MAVARPSFNASQSTISACSAFYEWFISRGKLKMPIELNLEIDVGRSTTFPWWMPRRKNRVWMR